MGDALSVGDRSVQGGDHDGEREVGFWYSRNLRQGLRRFELQRRATLTVKLPWQPTGQSGQRNHWKNGFWSISTQFALKDRLASLNGLDFTPRILLTRPSSLTKDASVGGLVGDVPKNTAQPPFGVSVERRDKIPQIGLETAWENQLEVNTYYRLLAISHESVMEDCRAND